MVLWCCVGDGVIVSPHLVVIVARAWCCQWERKQREKERKRMGRKILSNEQGEGRKEGKKDVEREGKMGRKGRGRKERM